MTNVSRLKRIDPFTDSAASVKARLRRKFGWTAANLDTAVEDIKSMTPSLRPAFRAFWNTGVYDANLRAGEFTLGELVAARILPAAAFLALDQVHKNPREATPRLRHLIRRLANPNGLEAQCLVSWSSRKPDIPTW